MNCTQFEQMIDAYLDDELSGSLRLEFDAHRLRCRRCQQTVSMLETTAHVIATRRDTPALRDDFVDRVMGRIARESKRRRISPVRFAIGLGIVLQAAAVLALVVLLRDSQGIPVGTPPEAIDVRDFTPGQVADYIFKRVAQAQASLRDDVGQLGRYALNLNVPEDVARASSNLLVADPIWVLLQPLFEAADESESVATGPDQYAL